MKEPKRRWIDGPGQIPEIWLERWAAGELSAETRAQLQARGIDDAELNRRAEALQRSNDEVLRDYPVRPMAAQIAARAEAESASSVQAISWARPWIWASTGAAAALAVVLLVTSTPSVVSPDRGTDGATAAASAEAYAFADVQSPEITRIKGGPRLFVMRVHDGVAVPLRDGDVARAGDRLQVSYLAAGATHGVIVSWDGAGAVTLHYPVDESVASAIQGGGVRSLPHSYVLDDAPEFERFAFVTSREPIAVRDVMDAAKRAATTRAATLDASETWTIKTWVLFKPAPNPNGSDTHPVFKDSEEVR